MLASADARPGTAQQAGRVVERLAQPVAPAVLRLRQAAVCLLLVVVAFTQSPGAISGDTKLDLTEDPGGWLTRALGVWTPDGLGQLQNQAYGYLFPMGPFHLAGAAAGLPAWVVQRLWWSVLLVAALLGVVRLAARLGIGTAGGRLLAGLAYALSPRVLTELGGISSELMPLAALPWILVPLTGPAAELRPRVAAARSGVAVLFAGGVNAAATLALLPLAAIWLLPGLRRPGGRRLAAWEGVAIVLACAWWIGPLLIQGSYSPPFLDSIETAATTTSTTSAVEVLRGTSHWLGYLAVDGQPWWRAAWTLVTSPIVILYTAVVAGLGLAGLASRRMPARGRLGSAALLGLLVMTAGFAGDLASPLSEVVRQVLDGVLAPFRNVHKFDPLLRLPLALGLGHLLTLLPLAPARRNVAVLAGFALLGAATPALAGQVAPAGAYPEVPAYWSEAAAWVDERAGTGTSLLVPAAGDAEHLWGRPLDDPLQVLADSPVAVRDAVPLGGPELTRLLDAVGARLDSGAGSPGLAPVLRRSGVRFVVVRNDLDPVRTGAPRPSLVAQALEQSAGLNRVARFGPLVGQEPTGTLVADRGVDRRRRAVEIYEVGTSPTSPVAVYPRTGAWQVSGGADALLQLADRGLLSDDVATVVGEESDPGLDPRTAQTDGLRRRTATSGLVRQNTSVTLTPEQPEQPEQAGPVLLPGGEQDRLVTAGWEGVRRVTVSSSAADPGAALYRGADRAAASAVDGDPGTSWVSGSLAGAQGQWLEVELERARDLTGATLTLAGPATSPALARVSEVEVRTEAGTERTRIGAGERAQQLRFPAGPATVVRVTVTGADPGRDGGRLVGVRELTLPGVEAARTLVLPPIPGGETAVVLLDRAIGARDGCVAVETGVRCSPELRRNGEEPGPLDRTFTVDTPQFLQVTGTAVPVPGPELDALLDEGARVRVRASSRDVADPRRRPSTVVDGDATTGWVAAADDQQPELRLSWDGPRRVTAVVLRTGSGLVAAEARRVAVRAGDGPEVVRRVPADGRVELSPATTETVTVRVLATEELVDVSRTGRLSQVPVGFSEVGVVGAEDLVRPQPALDEVVAVPCGAGPRITADGRPVPTQALGTRGDLLQLEPLLLEACPAEPFVLGAGEHRLVGEQAFSLDVGALTVGPALPTATPAPREVTALAWGDEARTVAVGPGEPSWLVVRENANRGWQAVLDGQVLEAARVDGWQQAWLLPAGGGGEVELRYLPGPQQRRWLAGGLAGVVLLIGLALWSGRATPAPARGGSARVTKAERAGPAVRGLRLALPALVLAVLGGPTGLAVWAGVALLARRRPPVLPVLALAALTGAGLVVALSPWSSPDPPGAYSAPAQVLALVAVAALSVSLAAPRRDAYDAGPAAPPGAG